MNGNGFKKALAALIVVSFLSFSCGSSPSDSGSGNPPVLAAGLKDLEQMHGLYFSLAHDARSIEIGFNVPLNPSTVSDNIVFSDKFGPLAGNYTLSVEGDVVVVGFEQGFRLKPGWKYTLSINTQVESVFGGRLSRATAFEIRTTSQNVFADNQGVPDGTSGRTRIVSISDVHMGDARAAENNYCWFSENKDALLSFVTMVRDNEDVRDLVILGDLFDEWLIPFSTPPFDGAVTDSSEYFRSIRNAPTNAEIFDVLAEISGGTDMNLVYVRGNHDMLTDQATVEELLPGVVFQGQTEGLGSYSPVDGVMMEHGHRYDFFNSPQPLASPGHLLPPGYFVSRLWAAGMEAQAGPGVLSAEEIAAGPFGDKEIEFPLAWDVALLYSEAQFPALVPPLLNDQVILMTGIDGYAGPFSFNGTKDMYVNGNIETLWPETQARNGVQEPMPVAVSILNGHSDLLLEADVEYLGNKDRGVRIVVFGHTHEPMLEVYPAVGKHTGIYANSGSWVNEASAGYIGGSANKVRTFVVLTPAAWTGSDLDVVTLYQYNPVNNGASYEAIKLAEESLDAGE